MSKHTPGPWAIEQVWSDDSTYRRVLVGASGDPVAYAVQPHEGDSWQDETGANESLIAAAPDLLEALERSLRAFCGHGDWSGTPVYDFAIAAIKKATGEA